MPNYFPEGDSALPTDSIERSAAKVVSQLPAALDKWGVDLDAAAYIALSGATDVLGIDAFVKGIKALGLWNNMVCWPLRGAQNAGTGTTAYSLGGLGTFNGTLVNGPTWGANGITFTQGLLDLQEHVSIPLVEAATAIAASGGYSAFNVLNLVSRSSANSNFGHRLNGKIFGGQLYTDSGGENLRAASSQTTGERYTNQNLPVGSFVGAGFKTTWGVLRTDDTGFSIYDTASANTTVATFGSPVPPPFEDGTAGNLMHAFSGWTGSVTVAMAAFWLTPTTEAQAVAVRNLYALTLGQSLSL